MRKCVKASPWLGDSHVALAKCSGCGHLHPLRYDGLVSTHVSAKSWPAHCPGSDKRPHPTLSDNVRPDPATQPPGVVSQAGSGRATTTPTKENQ